MSFIFLASSGQLVPSPRIWRVKWGKDLSLGHYHTKICLLIITVRSAITTKCADENKMLRQRTEKKRKVLQSMENSNKENGVDIKVMSHNVTM